jgi:hypothetical protein
MIWSVTGPQNGRLALHGLRDDDLAAAPQSHAGAMPLNVPVNPVQPVEPCAAFSPATEAPEFIAPIHAGKTSNPPTPGKVAEPKLSGQMRHRPACFRHAVSSLRLGGPQTRAKRHAKQEQARAQVHDVVSGSPASPRNADRSLRFPADLLAGTSTYAC